MLTSLRMLVDRGALKTSSCYWSGVDGGLMRDGWPRELSAESVRQFRTPVEIVPLGLEFSSPHESIFEFHLSLDTMTSHSGKK